MNQTTLSSRHERSGEETSCLFEPEFQSGGRTGVTSIRRKGATIQLLFFELDKLFLSPPVCNILFISHSSSRKIYPIYFTFLDFFPVYKVGCIPNYIFLEGVGIFV